MIRHTCVLRCMVGAETPCDSGRQSLVTPAEGLCAEDLNVSTHFTLHQDPHI